MPRRQTTLLSLLVLLDFCLVPTRGSQMPSTGIPFLQELFRQDLSAMICKNPSMHSIFRRDVRQGENHCDFNVEVVLACKTMKLMSETAGGEDYKVKISSLEGHELRNSLLDASEGLFVMWLREEDTKRWKDVRSFLDFAIDLVAEGA
eukprot:765390-Hanusia_phi.AAC.4